MTSRTKVLVSLALSGAWFVSQKLAWGGFYLGLAPVAAVIVALGARFTDRAALRGDFKQLALGLGLGALLAGLTQLLFAPLASVLPWLPEMVRPLYAASRMHAFGTELPAFATIVVAEELLWRGLLFEALREKLGGPKAVALASLVYALAQGGTGSWVVMAVALGFGLLWGAMRAYTDKLLPGLACHAVWTTVVVLAYPLA
jgi:membrane protease YdiL (CAAX protease family)